MVIEENTYGHQPLGVQELLDVGAVDLDLRHCILAAALQHKGRQIVVLEAEQRLDLVRELAGIGEGEGGLVELFGQVLHVFTHAIYGLGQVVNIVVLEQDPEEVAASAVRVVAEGLAVELAEQREAGVVDLVPAKITI